MTTSSNYEVFAIGSDGEPVAVQRLLESTALRMRGAVAGTRNEVLASCAYTLGTIGAQGLLSKDAAFLVLGGAAEMAGLRGPEIENTFDASWISGCHAWMEQAAVGETEKVDYLDEAARVLFEIEELTVKLSRSYPKSDPGWNRLKDRLTRLQAVATSYERLAALQRGIAPGSYIPSTRLTRELAEGFGTPEQRDARKRNPG